MDPVWGLRFGLSWRLDLSEIDPGTLSQPWSVWSSGDEQRAGSEDCDGHGTSRNLCDAVTGQRQVWARVFLDELGFPMRLATPLRTDNDGVLKQSTKTINHTTAKHYRIAQAYIREKVSNSTIVVLGEDTETNEADIFTKALLAPAFLRHQATIMGPQTLS